MFVYGHTVVEITATSVFLVVWVLSLAVTWGSIHWFSFRRRGAMGTLQQEARDSLEDFEEFLWCLDLGMDNVDGIVIREVEDARG